MKNNFWQKLKRPIMVLAPMADVTDAAFRMMIAKYGKPDVMWTEFVSCDGLISEGQKKLLLDLKYTESERPIVAQIFSGKPDNFAATARLIKKLGFDGIDINMGCPEKSICQQGAGSALIKNPKLAREIIRETIKGAGGLPVSVKTRVGFSKNEIETWLPELLKEDLAVVTIHARTRKEMSKVPADWSIIKRAVEIRNELTSKTLIFGNGDVQDLAQAEMRVNETGCDGVMIGRGIFGNPWLFNKKVNRDDLSLEQRFKVMVEHTKLYEKIIIPHKSFDLMKKHFKAYVSGFDGAKELRMKLMECENATEVSRVISAFLKNRQLQ